MTTPATQGATMTLPPCPIAGHDNPHHWHAKNPDLRSLQYPSAPGHTDDCADDTDEFASRCYSAHVPEPTEPAPTGEPCCCNINCGDYCDKCHGAPGEWRCKRHRREFGDVPTPTAPDLEVPPDAPSLVTLPTVDEIAKVLADGRDAWYNNEGEESLKGLHTVQAEKLAALLESRVPEPTPDPDEWVRVPVGTRITQGTWVRVEFPTAWDRVVEPNRPTELHRSDLDAILKPAPTPAEKLAEALSDRGTETWCADVLAALDAAGLTLAERGEK